MLWQSLNSPLRLSLAINKVESGAVFVDARPDISLPDFQDKKMPKDRVFFVFWEFFILKQTNFFGRVFEVINFFTLFEALEFENQL